MPRVKKTPEDPAVPKGMTTVAPLPFEKEPHMPKPTPNVEDVLDKTTKDVPKPGTEVMSYKDRLAALVAQTQKAEAPQGGYISLKGGRMMVGETRFPNDMIRAIVVEYRKDNEFYNKAYDPAAKGAAPVCAAIVRPHEVLTPWRKPRAGETPETPGIIWDERTGYVTDSSEPQVPPGDGCDSCGMLEWGSVKVIPGKSGKGKACRESRRLHLMAADQCTNPEDAARAPFLTLIPPPTSLDNFKRFANEATTVLKLPVFGVIVDISVEPHDAYQFMVHYKIVEAIKDEGILNALLTRHEQLSKKTIVQAKPDDDEATKNARGSNKF
jgi:hypothetical protein